MQPAKRLALAGFLIAASVAWAQQPVPQPFPRPAEPATRPAPPVPVGAAPAPAAEAPSEAMLGVSVYPTAEFLRSYDAGRGQRYYLFGATASFADLVTYYKNVLGQKGELVYDVPPTHMFEVGRFREETMAFPPGVTIKDYTWNGSAGYPNPRLGAEPARFRTIIQIVPVPPEERRR